MLPSGSCDVVLEPKPDGTVGVVAGPDARMLELAGREVRITSPDKVLFGERGETKRDVLSVVYHHLGQSRELLVLCSERSALSPWVDKEIRWFLEHRGGGRIRVAITEGGRAFDPPETYLPPPVLALAASARGRLRPARLAS